MNTFNAIATGTYYNRHLSGLPVMVTGNVKPHRTHLGFFRVMVQVEPQVAQQYGLPVEPFRLTLANRSDLIMPQGQYQPNHPSAIIPVETPEARAERIDNLFASAQVLVGAAVNRQMQALVLTSSGGLGKSYMLQQAVQESCLKQNEDFAEVKGNISAVGLYELLYNRRDGLVIIQDTDSIFTDETALSILKNALDTTGKRVLSWLTQNTHLAEKEIPPSFEFQGTCIFATNVDITSPRANSKIGRHLEAFASRVHLVDLHLRDREDILYLIRKICLTDRYCGEHDVTVQQATEVVEWMIENSSNIKNFNIRTVGQVLNLVRISPSAWRNLAKATLFNSR